ncbi:MULTISPECIES: YiiX/YebB-like N1pC/P60 family cysteine hydrolase [Flavobacterium]|uniref:YiiX/YebB-like N1pC/P60 family cysteine hydrolase n=1 Tax=Flavobacterium TaxID=237 RepID=UPI001FCC1835|nr:MULTISPECIES: YiiX/YebB-like N1pC/P60 family cysteine hydrolase [Flavobacterium]UOK43740.1 hypothetical protein LZF87_06365 [Flavobacterium enshiense]
MKSVFSGLILLFFCVSCGQSHNEEFNIDADRVYFIFRDSESKEGFFVKKFNLGNLNVTHVGFLVYTGNSWKVFHAINKKGNCVEQIEFLDFCSADEKKLNLRFLEISDFRSKKLLVSTIDSFKNRNLDFDYSFSCNNDKSIYCSRFVCEVLKSIDSVKYGFKLHRKKLNNIESSFLQKEILYYYPVDIFIFDKRFKSIS